MRQNTGCQVHSITWTLPCNRCGQRHVAQPAGARHRAVCRALSGNVGNQPGRNSPRTGQLGIVASKSVGPASISYDNSAISAQVDAGHWALTSYGLMYWELMRMVGTGGWQL